MTMKFAIHLSTFTKSYSEDLIPFVKRAAEIGYDAVELPVLEPLSFNISKMKSAASEYGVDILCSTGLSLETDISSLNCEIRNKGIRYLKRRIDIAQQLNSRQLTGVIYSPWGVLQSKELGKRQIENSILAVKEIADYASAAGVVIGLEILNRYEGYMINTVAEGIEFMNQVNKDNVKLHFDTFHAHIEETNMYEAITLGGKNIIHVHFCENTRGIPLTGQVHWNDVICGLREIEYDRYISIENFVNKNCEVGDSAMIWRQIEDSGDMAAVYGYENMLKLFGGGKYDKRRD